MTLAEPARQGAGTVHEIRLETAEFERIARLVREHAGISLPAAKQVMVQARLARRLRVLGLRSFADYAALVERKDAAANAERQEFISALTTNVTRFFREPHHFDALRLKVLPPLIERARRGGRVRLWSAGCSTGEEPYSIAIALLALAPDAGALDLRILATDLDRAVLATAMRGVYPAAALQAVPAAFRTQFEETSVGAGPAVEVKPAARALISFRQLNLTTAWPMSGAFDVIFCRNVVIYFDEATEVALWRAFAERLPAGGRLFIGHSERINTLALPMFASDGVSTYRKL